MLTSRLFGGMPTAARAADLDLALGGSSKPAIIRSVVVLPQPDGPSSARNSPLLHVEVDAVDRDEVTEALRDPAQDDVWSAPRLHWGGHHTVRILRLSSADKRSRPSGYTVDGSLVCSAMALRLDLGLLLLLPLRGE